jgi:hypothetical protein
MWRWPERHVAPDSVGLENNLDLILSTMAAREGRDLSLSRNFCLHSGGRKA